MSNVIQLPIIAGVEITVDAAGRFNLNALHRASGLGSHKRPSKWLCSEPTQELIRELQAQSPSEGLALVNGLPADKLSALMWLAHGLLSQIEAAHTTLQEAAA